MGLIAGAAGGTHAAAQVGIVDESCQAGRKRSGITRLRQKSGFSVDDDFAHAASTATDDRFGEHHGLDQDEAEGFKSRGRHEHIAALIKAAQARLRNFAMEDGAPAQALWQRLRLEDLTMGTPISPRKTVIADDVEPRTRKPSQEIRNDSEQYVDP